MGLEAAPLRQWPGTAGLLLAGRIARFLGAPRLSATLCLRAFRTDRHDFDASYYYASVLWERRGPLAAWQFVRARGELHGASPSQRADWLARRAALLAWFRDFDAADRLLDEADQLAPESPWLCVERARARERADRHDEALALANAALVRRPWYVPALHMIADLRQATLEIEATRQLLAASLEQVQASTIAWELGCLEQEQGELEAAGRAF